MRRSMIWLKWPYEEPPAWAGIWPLAVGFQSCAKPILNAVADYYCFHLVSGGKTRLRTGQAVDVLLGDGDVFMTWPGEPFTYFDETKSGPESWVYWIRLAGPLAREFAAAMGFSTETTFLKADKPQQARKLITVLMDQARGYGNSTDLDAVATLYKLAGCCRHKTHKPAHKLVLARRVVQFMAGHKWMNIEQVCAAFNISRSSLFLHFRKAYGKSPVEMLIEMRIEHARKMLRETNVPVGEVALASGYSDVVHFTHVFSSRVGAAPGAYRSGSR